ncbi:vacuolar calcium ion transporter [Penicillium riverlandense]|uniref:vacuolar calcium ion transporter n=1 Tax=Penicillium riverlandense TaxID=1903569 RepID=UPI00254784D9|nr:vacuolar calcium ion transporter [Penicillium riverlandense]KAJ5815403.1 vacuolar calcium ion transporter [Penicillium riverlandense]
MHIYRRHARELAWYDEEGEQPSHNPFKKIRARRRRNRPQRSDTIPLEDRPRELDLGGGDSSAFPPPSAGSGMPPSESMRSQEPINNTSRSLNDESADSQPRQRGGIFSKFGHHDNKDDVSSSEVDKPEPQKFTFGSQLKATIFNSWINVLFIAAPVGIALNYVNVNPIAVFVVNFIAIIPLAAMLSYATEEIAMRTGETIGGLLNASFGNAVELIVAIIALVHKQVLIVQTSLIGSMLSNLLLVMGMCFFFGGVNRLEQHFNPVVAQTAASLLALAVASLIIPTAFHWSANSAKDQVTPLSRGTAILLLVVYGCYLFFQLKSHTEIYNQTSPKVEKRGKRVSEGDASRGIAQMGKLSATMGGQEAQNMTLMDPDDEEEQPQLSVLTAVLTLCISTAFVGVCAEFMVGSIDALTKTTSIQETFVGLILLPIVGNAAEHATAVTVACKDKMDLAIGVAVGSSMQIALLVLPLIVVLGWILGIDTMTLQFDAFQVVLLFVSVLLVNYLISDGKSHWLEGVLLMTMYLIIAVAAWFYE